MKKLWIIGLVVLLVGAALFGAGWLITDGDYHVLDGSVAGVELSVGGRKGFSGTRGDGTWQERGYDFDAAGLNTLELREENAKLRVTVSSDDRIHLICQESADSFFEVTEKSGSLRLVRKNTGVKLHFSLFGDDELETELQLPRRLAANTELVSENGSVTLSRLTFSAAGSLSVRSQNGRVELRDVSCGALTLKSGNGRVEAENVSAASIDARSSNGAVTLTSCAAGGDLTAHASNGSVTLNACSAGDTADASSGNGSVIVEELSAGKCIRLDASNGGVRGTVAGSASDYAVTSKASNGSSNLPDSFGRGSVELKVTASNGSINLDFAED